MRLLLVENNNDLVESIKLCLKIADPRWEVIVKNNGKEALRELSESNYECLLVGSRLPDMGGLRLIKQLRIFSRMPAIIVNASSDRQAFAEAILCGADDYITKPFHCADLLKSLKHALADVRV